MDAVMIIFKKYKLRYGVLRMVIYKYIGIQYLRLTAQEFLPNTSGCFFLVRHHWCGARLGYLIVWLG